jgi:hypothetical protein
MSKQFKPIAVGKNETAKKEFTTNLERKFRLSNEFFEYIQRFIQVEDRNVLKNENPYSYFTDRFTAKFEGQFPPQLSVRKMFELMEVDSAKIDFLSSQMSSIKIEIDYNTGLPEHEPDFNYYTSSEEQNKIYTHLQKVADSLHSSEQFGIKVYPSNICQAYSGWMQFDFNSNKLIPNVSRILGMERTTY